jgi:hypothetical protein
MHPTMLWIIGRLPLKIDSRVSWLPSTYTFKFLLAASDICNRLSTCTTYRTSMPSPITSICNARLSNQSTTVDTNCHVAMSGIEAGVAMHWLVKFQLEMQSRWPSLASSLVAGRLLPLLSSPLMSLFISHRAAVMSSSSPRRYLSFTDLCIIVHLAPFITR